MEPQWFDLSPNAAADVPPGRVKIEIACGDNRGTYTIRYRRKLKSGYTRFYF